MLISKFSFTVFLIISVVLKQTFSVILQPFRDHNIYIRIQSLYSIIEICLFFFFKLFHHFQFRCKYACIEKSCYHYENFAKLLALNYKELSIQPYYFPLCVPMKKCIYFHLIKDVYSYIERLDNKCISSLI